LPCSSSLREEARRRETPASTGHLESITPTLSLREREHKDFYRGFYRVFY
jgi:hypothetical protein